MSAHFVAGCGLFVGLMATPAVAASYKFELHNESKYPITGFQTFEEGKWSTGSDAYQPIDVAQEFIETEASTEPIC